MAKGKVVRLRKADAVAAPDREEARQGLSIGKIELRAETAFRVRLVGGRLVSAKLAPDVDEGFAEECLRDKRTVLVVMEEGGAVIAGALQTSKAVSRDAHDAVRIEGSRVRIEADEGIDIAVGKSSLRLDKSGAVKIVGQKMTMDVATVLRVLSALVELP